MAKKRVLVTGGTTFLGLNIATALLSEGADVTLLIREGTEDSLGILAQKVRWYVADVWDTASLRGRARGHDVVVHTVGSMKQAPKQGFTFNRLNGVSARNVGNMCVSDGVERMVFMSTANFWWLRGYVASKREAEQYLTRLKLPLTIIRAPLAYVRGTPRPLFYRLLSLMGMIPPFSWAGMRAISPLPLDVMARGVARVALSDTARGIYYAHHLRQLNTREEWRGTAVTLQAFNDPASLPSAGIDYEDMGGELPFGWKP